MKLTIIGAGGVRTPLILNAIIKRNDRLRFTKLALLDIDKKHLELIAKVTEPVERSLKGSVEILRTTDAHAALDGADFVITTFRVGGIEGRILDEKVALEHNVIGQETTGPGGFAMAMRTIPVLFKYIQIMKKVCPDAWLINFANPSGLITEAVTTQHLWDHIVGICDGPSTLWAFAAAFLNAASLQDVDLDYFGLNHLGWIRSIKYNNKDFLLEILAMMSKSGGIPGYPFKPEFLAALGLIPNEYLYYFYNSEHALRKLKYKKKSRGEMLLESNNRLYMELQNSIGNNLKEIYQKYLADRHGSYSDNFGEGIQAAGINMDRIDKLVPDGYAGVALDFIEGISGITPKKLILNVPNGASIYGMEADDVVEICCGLSKNQIINQPVGDIPVHCLGLMKQVKAYEKLTIEAVTTGSYQKAWLALALHPLVRDEENARLILDEYIAAHHVYFPKLS
jgi:6-phospho-beta-glucosidase